MKNTIILVLIIVGALNFYEKYIKTNSEPLFNTLASSENNESDLLTGGQPKYQCDGRQHCSQMGSYEEAKFFLENCPNTKMDGDYDGIPCERQFGY